MLVILFSTFCVCSSAQNSQGNGLQQYEATNNNSLTIELIEAHISCNGLCDGSIGALVYEQALLRISGLMDLKVVLFRIYVLVITLLL